MVRNVFLLRFTNDVFIFCSTLYWCLCWWCIDLCKQCQWMTADWTANAWQWLCVYVLLFIYLCVYCCVMLWYRCTYRLNTTVAFTWFCYFHDNPKKSSHSRVLYLTVCHRSTKDNAIKIDQTKLNSPLNSLSFQHKQIRRWFSKLRVGLYGILIITESCKC